MQSIVGWFVYRANCSSRPSLLERSIHSSLMIALPHSPGQSTVPMIRYGGNVVLL